MKEEVLKFIQKNRVLLIAVLALAVIFCSTFTFYSINMKKIKDEYNGMLGLDETSYHLKGEGTEQAPFLISNKEELIEYADNLGCYNMIDNKSAYINLTSDIDLGGIDWLPIGERGDMSSFNGILDGCGHTISNFNIVANRYTDVGFICAIWEFEASTPAVKNLNLANGTLQSFEDHNSVGGLVGNSYGEISNCNVDMDITLQGSVFSSGGVVGMAFGNCVHDCSSSGSLNVPIVEQRESVKQENYTYPKYGGVIGSAQEHCQAYNLTNNMVLNFSRVDCVSQANVNINVNIGGVLGQAIGAYYNNLTNNADIYGVGGVGGVVGDCWSNGVVLENCTNNGNIYSTGGIHMNIGGIVANCYQGKGNKLLNCANRGNILVKTMDFKGAESQAWCGGLLGSGDMTIDCCVVSGNMDIQGELVHYVGGLAGTNKNIIQNSYCSGDITVSSKTSVMMGGLVGVMQETLGIALKSCYYAGTIAGRLTDKYTEYSFRIGGIMGYNMRGSGTTIQNNYCVSKKAESDLYILPTEWYGEDEETEHYVGDLITNNCITDTQTMQNGKLIGLQEYNKNNPTSSGVWVYEQGKYPKLYWE